MQSSPSSDGASLWHKYAQFAWKTLRTHGWRATARDVFSELSFDLYHGTETLVPRDLARLETTAGSRSDGVQYQGANPRVVRRLLGGLPPETRDFCFVDFGCGKGRGLLLGIEAGFTRLAGVEFAPELAALCRANLARARRLPKVSPPEISVLDAAEYLPPRVPLVAFLYNPFRGNTLRRVVAQLTQHASLHGPVWIVYVNPCELTEFTSMGWNVVDRVDHREKILGVTLARCDKE